MMRKNQQIKKSLGLDNNVMLDRAWANVHFDSASELELKELGEQIPDGYVAGWASTPDVDLYNHKILPGAFDESIQARGLKGPKSVKLLIGHNSEKIGGVIKKLETRNNRLWIEAQLNLNISYVRDVYEAARMTGGLNFSVGFMLQDYSIKQTEEKTEYLQIEKGDLYEVSVVALPGNEEATMEFIKSREDESFETIAGFEKYLVAKGLARSRNEASKITQVVKGSVDLFKKPDENLIKDTEKGPLLDEKKLGSLMELITKMKNTLTS